MSGGGGAAIAAMLQALRSNRTILKSKRKIFDKHPAKGELHHQELKFKQATPEELQAFREKLQTEKKRQSRITLLIYFIGVLLLALLIFLISN